MSPKQWNVMSPRSLRWITGSLVGASLCAVASVAAPQPEPGGRAPSAPAASAAPVVASAAPIAAPAAPAAGAPAPVPAGDLDPDVFDVEGTLDPGAETLRTAQFWIDHGKDADALACFPALAEGGSTKSAVSHLKDKVAAIKAAEARAKDATLTAVDRKAAKKEADRIGQEMRSIADRITARKVTEFESYLENTSQRKACDRLRAAYIAYGASAPKAAARDEDSATKAAVRARAQDILRKAAPLTSALGSGNGFLEGGGAPDRAIFSLLTALGADQATNGTSAVMTLGLANLFGWTDEERLSKPAAARNLFLRSTLPLSATKPDPIAGAPADTPSGGSTPASVTRMSFVLGTSLLDDTDPRLGKKKSADGQGDKDANMECYRSVVHYFWTATTEVDESSRAEDRAPFFDECNRRAAEKQRVAVRAGVGLLVEDQKTKVETAGAALVWAPTSWLYFNGLYQRLFLPSPRHSFGGGLSFGCNLGGQKSGVDAWTRLGLDALVLGVLEDGKSVETEVRLMINTKFKLGDNVLTVGIGPRMLGDGLSSPGALASVGLSYDADDLIGPLLAGPSAPIGTAASASSPAP